MQKDTGLSGRIRCESPIEDKKSFSQEKKVIVKKPRYPPRKIHQTDKNLVKYILQKSRGPQGLKTFPKRSGSSNNLRHVPSLIEIDENHEKKHSFKNMDSVSEIPLQKKPKNKPNKRCLLANDHDFLLTIFENQLEKHFEEIEKAVDGNKALQAVKSNPADYFDLIILDVNMPIMDGSEACQKILEYFAIERNKRQKEQKKGVEYAKSGAPANSSQSMIDEEKVNGFKSPYVYALTSDLDQRLMVNLKQVGFRNVYQELNEAQMREIFTDSNLVFNEQPSSGEASICSEEEEDEDEEYDEEEEEEQK